MPVKSHPLLQFPPKSTENTQNEEQETPQLNKEDVVPIEPTGQSNVNEAQEKQQVEEQQLAMDESWQTVDRRHKRLRNRSSCELGSENTKPSHLVG